MLVKASRRSVFGKRENPGYLLVNLDFLRFWPISLEIEFFTRNEAQEQHSLLDTIFDYIFYFGPPGKYLYLSLAVVTRREIA